MLRQTGFASLCLANSVGGQKVSKGLLMRWPETQGERTKSWQESLGDQEHVQEA